MIYDKIYSASFKFVGCDLNVPHRRRVFCLLIEQTIFCVHCVGMFTIYLLAKCHVPKYHLQIEI
jgi:hypothetical protein